MPGLCDECKWFMEDERSGPHCRPCNMGRADNWEPVVKEKEEPVVKMNCHTCVHKDISFYDCSTESCDDCPCDGCMCGSEDVNDGSEHPNWTPKEDPMKVAHNFVDELREREDFKELLDGFQEVPTFDNESMATLLQDIQRKEFEIWQGKNSDYASRGHDGNPFANFERIAAKLQLDRKQILMVYLEKHLCAIEMYIKHGTLESGEGLLGRIIDARNYLAILAGMAKQEGVI